MRKHEKRDLVRRWFSLALALVMMVGYLPATASAETAEETVRTKVADNTTWNRLESLYAGDTLHAGKVTVDKSVSTEGALGVSLKDPDNFLVTVSQMSQVMALTTEMQTPVDVVFVLDTSGSMDQAVTNANGQQTGDNRSATLVKVVNDTIADLMAANANNRVAVVAFSAYNAGGVDAGGDAANVLSALAHYEGKAATEHLTWDTKRGQGPSWAVDAPLIRGRNANGTVGKGRAGYHGATNIQAGVAKGASLLMSADTTVTINGQSVIRMPFLIILSDGAPVSSSSNNDWTNPSMTLAQGTNGDPLKVGNSFLPILTAAYYKQQISQRYYPNGEDSLSIYTMGFAVDPDEKDMSAMTLNPSMELSNEDNDWHDAIHDVWDDYSANNKNFSIDVGKPAELANGYSHDGKYYFYYRDTKVAISNVNDIQDNTTSISAERYYGVSGNNATVTFTDNIVDSLIPANKSIQALAYNDGYFDVNNANALENAFESIMTEITHKAISSPTQISGDDYNFDGYVTFTDVIGEYMEVKDMKGILVGETFYQGRYVAQNLGDKGSDNVFDAMALKVIATRFKMADSTLSDAQAQTKAKQLIDAGTTYNTYNSKNTQAYYVSPTDYSNSLV